MLVFFFFFSVVFKECINQEAKFRQISISKHTAYPVNELDCLLCAEALWISDPNIPNIENQSCVLCIQQLLTAKKKEWSQPFTTACSEVLNGSAFRRNIPKITFLFLNVTCWSSTRLCCALSQDGELSLGAQFVRVITLTSCDSAVASVQPK